MNAGEWVLLRPKKLSLPPELAELALENRFKCTRCGSRKTCDRPHFNSGSKLTGFANPLKFRCPLWCQRRFACHLLSVCPVYQPGAQSVWLSPSTAPFLNVVRERPSLDDY